MTIGGAVKTRVAESYSREPTEWDLGLSRDVLTNANETLRTKLGLQAGLLAGCITLLNVIPRSNGPAFLDDLDRWVFIPALISMVITYFGLQKHCKYDLVKKDRMDQLKEIYAVVQFKYKMLHWSSAFLILSAVLLGTFVLAEFK